MKAHFTYKADGLTVSFNPYTSLDVPIGANYSWNFGDGSPVDNTKNPDHTYSGSGFFTVGLTLTSGSQINTFTRTIGVAENWQPLATPLYNLVDQYLPAGFVLTSNDREIKIQKWQLWLSPLVNHEIPLDEIYNEFAYTPLENTLIANLIAYDVLIEGANKYLIESGVQNGGEIKKMVQGPAETEWFQGSDLWGKVFKKAGVFDSIQQNICGLASRLEIYIAGICPVPEVPYTPFVIQKIDTSNYDSTEQDESVPSTPA